MSVIRGSFNFFGKETRKILDEMKEDVRKNTGVNDFPFFIDGDNQMGQVRGYDQLQALMQQQNQSNIGAILGQLGGQGIAAQDLRMGQLVAANQINGYGPAQRSIYPGQIFQHQDLNPLEYHKGQRTQIAKIAEEFGFEYDFDTGGWKSKYDGFVSRIDVEGIRFDKIREIFQKKKCPSMHWLDTRVEEMRVKLC